jgi:hypothetical protein
MNLWIFVAIRSSSPGGTVIVGHVFAQRPVGDVTILCVTSKT